MKRYHIILLLVINAIFASKVSAIVVQTIHLKDGSVLNGYIEKQEVNGLLTISTDNAIICAKSDSIKITHEQVYSEKDLDEAWLQWATDNDAFHIQNNVKKLTLSDLTIRDGKTERHYNKVRIIEKGPVIKFQEITPNKYICQWTDVEKITADKRTKTDLSGMNRTYQLRNGSTYNGEYAEETDSTLSLYLNDGSVMTFKTYDVIKYTFSPINPNQSLFEQTPLVDIVDSKSSIIEGVIVEQSYVSNSDSVNYIIIQQENGTRQEIKIADIKTTSKKLNPSFNPLTDILLRPDEVVVNRNDVGFFDVIENGNYLLLEQFAVDSLKKDMVFTYSDSFTAQIVVECNIASELNVQQIKLVKMLPIQLKKRTTLYGFSFKDLVSSVYYPSNVETSVNKTTKIVYQLKEGGYYALYDPVANKAIPIKIIKK